MHNALNHLRRRRNQIAMVALVLPLGTIAVMAWLFVAEARAYRASFGWIERSYVLHAELDTVHDLFEDVETAQRGYLLSGNREFLQPDREARPQIEAAFRRLELMLANEPARLAQLQTIQTMGAERLRYDDETLQMFDQGREKEAVALVRSGKGRVLMERLQAAIATMKENERRRLEVQKTISLARSARYEWLMGGMFATAFLAVGLLIYLLRWVYRLQSLVTVCAWTQRVQIDGQWVRFEEYLSQRFGLQVSHGISAEGAKKILDDLAAHRKSEVL